MSKQRFLYLILSLVLLGAVVASCGPATNYLESEAPKFTGDFTETVSAPKKTLKVVTFNIKYAQKIDQAIDELAKFPELRDVDIFLLQEMDLKGTERIARALQYNYVYYPASLHPRYDKYFGNAIISRWPIGETNKVLLPHKNPVNKQRRIAISATILVGNDTLKVYSVHAEVPILTRTKRVEQVKTLIRHISEQKEFPYIIVGGDFNTALKKDIKVFTTIFTNENFEWATEGIGATAKLSMALDHIYTKGMEVIDAGKIENTRASDHLPVWVVLGKKELRVSQGTGQNTSKDTIPYRNVP